MARQQDLSTGLRLMELVARVYLISFGKTFTLDNLTPRILCNESPFNIFSSKSGISDLASRSL
jgi:hypothetical protein